MIWNAQADLKNSSNHKKTVSQESLNINKWNHKILYPYTYIQYTYTKHSHEGMRTGTPENGCCFSASKLYLEEANQKIKADTVSLCPLAGKLRASDRDSANHKSSFQGLQT